MPETIDHPDFGRIVNQGDVWTGDLMFTEWASNRWPTKIGFVIEGDAAGPDPIAADRAKEVIARQSTLAEVLVRGLWAEIDGSETESENWWTGDLNAVNENLSRGMPAIAGPADLYRVLRPTGLHVFRDVHGDDQFTAGFDFQCDFECEHGLDVFTDGDKVLGSGGSGNATKYKRYARP